MTLRLPFPLIADGEYYLVAQGADGAMVTAGHTAQRIAIGAGGDAAVDSAVLGLRRIESVGAGLLALEFGPDFSPAAGSDPADYTVTVAGKPASISAQGRISRVDTYVPTGWPYRGLPRHEVFLQLGKPLTEGDKVEVSVAGSVTTATATAAMAFGARTSLTNSIKVNQVGYLTDSPVKMAYLGRWLGSFPERPAAAGAGGAALFFPEAPEFHVCSAADGRPVFTARSRLVHRSGDMNEGVYKADHSGENVYLLDFTSFKAPGRYFLSVEAVGRSLPFEVGDDVYRAAFEVQAYGVFAQRCGIAMGPPYSEWRRVVCHDRGLIATSQIHAEKHDLKELPGKAVNAAGAKASGGDALVVHAGGGHHDAGDYNPRSHLDVAMKLMDAWELARRNSTTAS